MADVPSIVDVRQWEIWQVYWGHEDGTGKERPALAVTTAEQSVAAGHIRFLKITGQDHPEVPCRVMIDSRYPDFRHTGLDCTSWIHLLDDQKIPEASLRYRRGHINRLTAAYIGLRLSALLNLPKSRDA